MPAGQQEFRVGFKVSSLWLISFITESSRGCDMSGHSRGVEQREKAPESQSESEAMELERN